MVAAERTVCGGETATTKQQWRGNEESICRPRTGSSTSFIAIAMNGECQSKNIKPKCVTVLMPLVSV